MIIKKLEIHKFGKFENFEFSLTDGLNTVCRDNEFGKSTMADFICFVLYGFTKSRARSAEMREDLLTKYMPWDGGETIAGALEVQTGDGRHLRLERSQNSKGKSEFRMMATDGSLIEGSDAGELLSGLDRESFLQTFYIRQRPAALHNTERIDIAMKNLVTSGEENVSFDTVLERLWAQKKAYQHRGKTGGALAAMQGEIETLAYEITALEQQVAGIEATLPARGELEQQQAVLDRQIDRLIRAKQAAEDSSAKDRLESIENTLAALEECKQQQQALPFTQLLDSEQIAAVRALEAEIKANEISVVQAREQAEKLQTEGETAPAQVAALLDYTRTGAVLQKNKKTKWVVSAILSGLLALGAGVAAWRFGVWYGYAAAAVFAALAVVFSVVGAKQMPIPAPLRAVGITAANLADWWQQSQQWQLQQQMHRQQVEKQKQIYNNLQQHGIQLQQQLSMQLEGLGLENMQALHQYEQCRDTLSALKEKRQMLEAQYGQLCEGVEMDLLRKSAKRQVEALDNTAQIEEQLQTAREQRAELLQKMLQVQQQRSSMERLRESVLQKSDRKAYLTQQWQKDNYQNQVLGIAIAQLETAHRQLRENYAPLLQQTAGTHLSRLTDGKYDTLTIDQQFGVKVKADGALRPLGYFSQGTVDAVYLALRLALAQIVEGTQKLPFIMDDSFASMDGARIEQLCAMLREIAKERQILFLTCQSQLGDALGAQV